METDDPRSWAHAPDRPGWQCHDCGGPWPCCAKVWQLRDELARDEQGVRTHVHLYLGSRLVEAAGDLPTVAAGDLYERFMGWIQSASPHTHDTPEGRP